MEHDFPEDGDPLVARRTVEREKPKIRTIMIVMIIKNTQRVRC